MVLNILLRLPRIAFFAQFAYAFAPPETETSWIKPPMNKMNKQMCTFSEILIPITEKRTSNKLAFLTSGARPFATAME